MGDENFKGDEGFLGGGGDLKHATFSGQMYLSHWCESQHISIIHTKQRKTILKKFVYLLLSKSYVPNMLVRPEPNVIANGLHNLAPCSL